MKSFQLIQKGDKVFDSVQFLQGVVVEVNYDTNVASITTGSPSEDELILCKLANLVVMKQDSAVNIPIRDIKPSKKSVNENKYFHKVKEFHEDFDHPTADKPTQMELSRATARSVWTGEEALVEFLHASSKDEKEFNLAYDNMIDGLEKAKKKSLAMNYYEDGMETTVAQSDALIDALYFIMGSFVELGVEPDNLFDSVHNSNMSKLFTDKNGKKFAKYRESDGKILKSPEFFPPEPELEKEIKRQLNK